MYAFDGCAEGGEPALDVLVAPVYLLDVADHAHALCRHGGDEQCDAGADVGRGHLGAVQLHLVVVSDDDGAVGVAEDDLCAHVDELVDEEEAALEHLLMDEHGAFGLGGDDEEDAQQVGREAGPGGVGDGHGAAVHEGLHLVVPVLGDVDVVADAFDGDTDAPECLGNDAEVLVADVLDGDVAAGHGCHADEGADLDHVGQDGVVGAVQCGDALDGQQVGADAGNPGAHGVEHPAELLDVGLAGGVVDGGGASGQDGGHDDVGGARHAGLVQEHVCALQLVGINLIDPPLDAVVELGTQLLNADEVSVESPAPDLVASGLGHAGLVEAGEERAEGEDAAPQGCTALHELLAAQILHVEVVGLELPGVVAQILNPDTHPAHEVDEVVDIEDVRHIPYDDRLGRQQNGRDDLQGLVLGTLRYNLSMQFVSAFYDK